MATLWTVCHYRDCDTAAHNAAITEAAGAHGMFLINMHGEPLSRLAEAATVIRERHPTLALGVNGTAHRAHDVVRLLPGMAAYWCDAQLTHSSGLSMGQARHLHEALFAHGRRESRAFVGVAFKYQPHEPAPLLALARARALGFTACTSGPGTGKAPNVDLVAQWGSGPAPLAVASGLTPDNVTPFLPYVTDYLVATGISRDFHRLDLAKTTALATAIREGGRP